MTRDEARVEIAKRIVPILAAGGCAWDLDDTALLAEAFEILDSINGFARVNLPEATEEMIRIVICESYPARIARADWYNMSCKGDLTNAPEPKP